MVRQMWSAADGSRRRPHSTGLLRHVRVDTAAPDGLLVTQPGQLTNYSFAQLENATVTIFHSWVTSKKRIKRWWPHNDTLVVAGVISDRAAGSQNRYYIENIDDVPSLAPGAFIFNAATRNITYRALPGEDPRLPGQALIVPRLSSVLSLYGSVVGTPSATSGWVEHIRILNLTVAHTSAMLEEQCMMVGNGCAAQSAADLKSGAVETGNGVRNVVFDGLTVTSTGGYGVWLKPGTYNTSIVAALMRDLGAGGIRVGNPVGGLQPLSALIPSGITVADSLIEDGGKIVEAGVGILLHQATSSFLVHNTIRDLYYSGISTGWTWGYAPTSTAALTVGFNHIYRIGRGVLSDMACIYNLGISPGTLFHNNVCHDVRSAGYGSWGLYNDEGTSNVTWRDNIVWGTQAAAFHQHYGLDNLIENNVLAFPWGSCTPADICDAAAVRASTHGTPTSIGAVASFAMRGNLILLNQSRTSFFYTTFANAMLNMTLDRNVYWNYGNATIGAGFPSTQAPRTWSGWRAIGQDSTSVIADPQLQPDSRLATAFDAPGDVAAAHSLGALALTSPARAVGFTPIDTSAVGPRPWAPLALPLIVNVRFALARSLGSNMVLQRGSEGALLWGFGDMAAVVTAVASFLPPAGMMATVGADNVWRLRLPAMPAGGPYALNLTISTAEPPIMLSNVLFGDVYVCSGQSNMGMSIVSSWQPEADIAYSGNYSAGVRFHGPAQKTSYTPLTEFPVMRYPWTVPSPTSVGGFSAACWYFGTRIYDALNRTVPIGLVGTYWGGTRIEAWSSPAAHAACNVTVPPPAQLPPSESPLENNATVLFNAMVNPLLVGPMAITGFTWSQGEANTAYPELYRCQMAALIADWRLRFGKPDAFFALVMMPPLITSSRVAAFREAQIAAVAASGPRAAYATQLEVMDPSSPRQAPCTRGSSASPGPASLPLP